MTKRIPLNERREHDRKGIDAIVTDTTPPQETSSQPGSKKQVLKVTIYVRPEQVTELEEIQLAERRRTGKRPDKSDLVQEAIDLLVQKYKQST
jgi:hypothetical protein